MNKICKENLVNTTESLKITSILECKETYWKIGLVPPIKY